MKKVLFIAVALLAMHNAIWAQACPPAGIMLVTQQHVNNFQLQYPGCTTIEGDLRIGVSASSNISDLSPLNSIERVNGSILITNCSALLNLDALSNLTYVEEVIAVINCGNMTSVAGLTNVEHVTDLTFGNLPQLDSIASLDNLTSLSSLYIYNCPLITNLSAFENLQTLGAINITNNASFNSFSGMQNITELGRLILRENPSIIDIQGLTQVTRIGWIDFNMNNALTEITGLSGLTTLGPTYITNNNALLSLAGLDNVTSIKSFGGSASLQIINNPRLKNLAALGNLQSIYSSLVIDQQDSLTNLIGLENLIKIGGNLSVSNCNNLESLQGLEQLDSINRIIIQGNPQLTSLGALAGLSYINTTSNTIIENNPMLSVCDIEVLCNKLLINPYAISLSGNAAGCNTLFELEQHCGADEVQALVLVDVNNNCEADESDTPVSAIQVLLENPNTLLLRETEADGIAHFGNFDTSLIALNLPQLPAANWMACQDVLWISPFDTIIGPRQAVFLLQSLDNCPKPTVELGLPSFFSKCNTNSNMQATVINTGGAIAENVKVAVIIPSDLLEVTASDPIAASHIGDTLLFDVGNLGVLVSSKINMTVNTRCDVLLPEQSVCLSAWVNTDNSCEEPPEPHAKITAEPLCIGDTLVRFTLTNTGNAPTQTIYNYRLIENEIVVADNNFNLDPQAFLNIDVPATGATYRIETTRFDNGELAAVAIENCGGFTPGFITAYWMDQGNESFDFDCRIVKEAYGHNYKTAVPTGAGNEHLIVTNRPIDYTIEFQNTGTDTAYRVQLLDVLSSHLDINTFRPGFSSHPYSWQIRGGDTLEVLFYSITLPDSAINEAASKGFFSYSIHQKPNLPGGTLIENTASILFDFNPPIVTNTVLHTIGKLLVGIEEQQSYPQLWKVLGNPTNTTAVFECLEALHGENLFELYDANGRLMRTARFFGQQYAADCSDLPGGIYFFRILDAKGRPFTGKVVVGG